MLDILDKLSQRICNLLLVLGGLSVVVMMLNITFDVLAKSFFSSPIPGTLEMTTYYYMPVAALAAIAIQQRDRQHIMVELFTQRLSPRINDLLDALMSLLALTVMVLVVWFSTVQAIHKTAIGEFVYIGLFDLAIWPARWIVPAISSVFVLVTGIQFVACIARALKGQYPDGPSETTAL